MSKITIDKEILKCSINQLTLNEILVTLENNGITVNRRDKKHEVISSILDKLDNDELSEKLYLDFKTKAFSTNVDFFDGFFYRFNIETIEFNPDSFMKALEDISKNENSSSRQRNITFHHQFFNIYHDENNKILKFTFSRESCKGIYDYRDDGVKFFHSKLKADIEIYYETGSVYIHSKNSSESTTIKALLQKALNKLITDKTKLKLTVPKFNNTIVEKWNKDNKFTSNQISVVSIHMLDLLFEFENEENNFSEFGIKRLYLEHEVIDTTEDAKISGLIFLGENLQERNEILLELNKGQKIKGFEIQATYNYYDCETCDENPLNVLVSIVHDNNNSIRISLGAESLVPESILSEVYNQLKIVFLNKLNSDTIKNTDNLILFVNKCNDVHSTNLEQSSKKEQRSKVY
ncbi:hypothetical protein GM168_01515 [Clostridium perfringens]|nr:hypothetical protein [Clostridium perfringens]MDK0840492.1 hypothetical protein [Clostridium perfringens]